MQKRDKGKKQERRSKTCSKTSKDINVFITGDDDNHAEKSDDQCCPRISQSELDSIDGDTKEKFSKLIKRLIDQKENEVESCKNMVDSKEESCVNIGTPISEDSQRFNEKISQCIHIIVILKPGSNSLEVGSSPGTNATANQDRYGRYVWRWTTFLHKCGIIGF